MAIGASHLARCDFGLKAFLAGPTSGQLHDVRALIADVIELEYAQLRSSAVNAPPALQDAVGVLDACGLVLRSPARHRSPVRGTLSPLRPLSGSPTVTVHADRFASGDLALQGTKRQASRNQLRDVAPFLAEVIELDHPWVSLSTVRAALSR